MLVEQVPGRGARPLEVDRGVEQGDLRGRGARPDRSVDRAVGAEAQRVEVARTVEVFAGALGVSRFQQHGAEPVVCLGVAVVDRECVAIGRRGGRQVARIRVSLALVEERSSRLGRDRVQRRVGERGERWRAEPIDRDGRQNDTRAGVASDRHDVGEVLVEVLVDGLEAGVVRCDALGQEHLHARPLRWPVPSAAEQVVEELPDAGSLELQVEADRAEVRAQRAEHRRRAVGADDLVVAHVDDEQVGLEARTVDGDLAHDVRVDRRHGGVVDLEALLGEARDEHLLEPPRDAEGRLRRPHRRRSAEEEDPIDVVRLLLRELEGWRRPSDRRREEAPAERRVGRVDPRARGRDEEPRVVSEVRQPERALEAAEQERGHQSRREQVARPTPRAGGWRRSIGGRHPRGDPTGSRRASAPTNVRSGRWRRA